MEIPLGSERLTAGIYGELKLLKGYLLEKLQKDKHSDFFFFLV